MSASDSQTTGINPEIIRGILRQVDRIGWDRSHHLPVESLNLSLDESCQLGALLRRYLQDADR